MERDTKKMRGAGPYVFAQVKHDVGVEGIIAPGSMPSANRLLCNG
jgi:hypothetical protein